jgi:hypothetical protein
MMARQGGHNIVAFAAARDAFRRESQIALKWGKDGSEINNKAIDYERNCLRLFRTVPGVVITCSSMESWMGPGGMSSL